MAGTIRIRRSGDNRTSLFVGFFVRRVFICVMGPDDPQLLRRYAREGAEEAFAELVRRHADLVWSAAWRVTRNASLSEDVVQSVFEDLARKARWLPEKTILVGWLYRAACLSAANALRSEARRLRRERVAMQLQSASENPEQPELEQLLPLLDEAMGALSETDRNTILLRYFAKKNMSEVGAAMGISDDAAQKRISRALDKLRQVFQRKGITASAGGLAAVLGSAGAQAAPAGLAGAVTLSSISIASSATAGSGVWAALSTIPCHAAIMKTQLAVAAVVLAGVGTPLIIQNRSLSELRNENRALAAEASSSDDLRQRHAALLKQMHAAGELDRLRQGEAELARLKAEAERLRAGNSAQKLELHKRLHAAQATLDLTREAVRFEQARIEFEDAQTLTINHMKQLGLAARIWAADNHDQLPTTMTSMTNELTELLPVALEQFELVEHPRPLSDIDARLLLFRERAPRLHPGGSWHRVYGMGDGSVQTLRFADPAQFDQWEKQFLAFEAPKQ
jgi:RNA polymerase sigma factor (sigma-70 family)